MVTVLLNKSWELLKPHIPAIVLTSAVVIGGFVLLSDVKEDLVSRLQKQQAIHDEELKKVNAVVEAERRQHEENVKKLNSELAAIRQKYDEQIRSLEQRKADQVSGLVKQFNSDPVGMARRLSQLTGFKLVIPEK